MYDHFQLQSHILFLSNLHFIPSSMCRHIISQRCRDCLILVPDRRIFRERYRAGGTSYLDRDTRDAWLPAAASPSSRRRPCFQERNNHSRHEQRCQRLGLCRFLVVLRIPVNHISHRMIVDNRIESRSLNQVRDCLALRL